MGAIVLAIALLGHLASTGTEQRLSEQQRVRSSVLQTSRQFMERLRSDEDWAGLYSRLRSIQVATALDGKTGTALQSGKLAWAPDDYFDGIVLPSFLDDLRVRVEVPMTPTTVAAGGTAMRLREDANLTRFGLPKDLNGDGLIDADPRDNDYVALPVEVTFRWVLRGRGPRELRVSTWLRGDR